MPWQKKAIEKPSSVPDNALSFTVADLNIKDKVKVENLTQDEFLLTVQVYEGDWKTVGVANFSNAANSSKIISVATKYEDKLKKLKKNTWCVVFPSGVNSNRYALNLTDSRHDLLIQVYKK